MCLHMGKQQPELKVLSSGKKNYSGVSRKGRGYRTMWDLPLNSAFKESLQANLSLRVTENSFWNTLKTINLRPT